MWSLFLLVLASFFGDCHRLAVKGMVRFEALVCQCLGQAIDFTL